MIPRSTFIPASTLTALEHQPQKDYVDVPVTDASFVFLSGSYALTIQPEDTLSELADRFDITVAATGETITVFKTHLVYVSSLPRISKKEVIQ